MPIAAQVLLTRLRTHGRKYCSGRRLPIAGASEQCEREVEAQEEVVQETEACQVRFVGAVCQCLYHLPECGSSPSARRLHSLAHLSMYNSAQQAALCPASRRVSCESLLERRDPEGVHNAPFERDAAMQELSKRTPIAELDWPDWAAVRGMATARDASKQIKLHSLRFAASLLDAKDTARKVEHSFGIFRWPGDVWATSNFLFATAQQSALSGYLRLPSTLLLFPDGSILLPSEREAEHIVDQLASAPAPSAGDSVAPPCVANLAFARDAFPSEGGELRCPLLVGPPPPPELWGEVALGVAALQLFAGETGYRREVCRGYRESSAAQDRARVRLAGSILLGKGALQSALLLNPPLKLEMALIGPLAGAASCCYSKRRSVFGLSPARNGNTTLRQLASVSVQAATMSVLQTPLGWAPRKGATSRKRSSRAATAAICGRTRAWIGSSKAASGPRSRGRRPRALRRSARACRPRQRDAGRILWQCIMKVGSDAYRRSVVADAAAMGLARAPASRHGWRRHRCVWLCEVEFRKAWARHSRGVPRATLRRSCRIGRSAAANRG